jgi:hypothetical protein
VARCCIPRRQRGPHEVDAPIVERRMRSGHQDLTGLTSASSCGGTYALDTLFPGRADHVQEPTLPIHRPHHSTAPRENHGNCTTTTTNSPSTRLPAKKARTRPHKDGARPQPAHHRQAPVNPPSADGVAGIDQLAPQLRAGCRYFGAPVSAPGCYSYRRRRRCPRIDGHTLGQPSGLGDVPESLARPA